MDTESAEKQAIRELLQNWVMWRDAGDWERFRTVWHEDGYMMATWFQGPASEFIRASREGWNRGVSILHFLGGISVDVDRAAEPRGAISQTKMTISQRAKVHEVLCDVVCTGRFYDFLEKRGAGRRPDGESCCGSRSTRKTASIRSIPRRSWNSMRRFLQRFPEGYRHLAYLQTRIGYQVKLDMPGLKGPEVEALYARGKKWLAGESVQA